MGNEYGLQYIMDGNGNYYRVNGNDQLVVAGRKEDASVFSMYEANQRIGGGKKSKFYVTIPVDDNEQPVEPTFPKVISIVDKTEVSSETIGQEPEEEHVADSVDRSNVVNVTKDNTEVGYDISNMDWMDYMNLFCYLVASAKNYQESMAEKHSKVEKEICDLLHYIELYDLSEDESMHAVELIKEARMSRRDIKDEIMRVELFQRSIGTSANVSKAKGCITELKKLETRIYHPREHSELFVGMDSRKTDRTFIREEQNREETFYEESKSEQEVCMEYCRKETIFDDRQNDWTEMAMQQYNFFTNIQQYMINVEIRLDELDQSIEDSLMAMEDANYNVTQGYKAYKELKELRNERKKLLEEFEQLQMMVGCFDCNAMADAYGYIVENSIGTNVGDG